MKGVALYYLKVFSFFKNTNVFILSFSLAGCLKFVEKYIYSDWQFAFSIIILIVVDTVLAMYAAYKNKQPITSRKFSAVFEKIIVYFSMLVMTKVLMSFLINGSSLNIFSWVDEVVCSFVVVRESISILEKATDINETLVPKWLLSKLKGFAVDGKFDNLKDPNNESN